MAETTETAETSVSAILARAADLLETTTIDPKTVLAKAADIIEEDGWQQGGYGNNPGVPHCAVGALYCAAREEVGVVADDPFLQVVLAKLAAKLVVADLGLTGNISVESWNDSLPCDDGAATVIEIFRRLAAA